MDKLKAMIQYECMTSFKYACMFYVIQYAVVILITVIGVISTGRFDAARVNVLEMNSIIYVSIVSILYFKEEFKMLIQNGFTRKYIFAGGLAMFACISGTMALTDTIIGNVIHYFRPDYASLYGAFYGYGTILGHWLWLFLVYMLTCTCLYFVVLVINTIGKKLSVCFFALLGAVILLAEALFQFVLSSEITDKLTKLLHNALGLMSDGTVNYLFQIRTLLILVGMFCIGSYAVIRRTELK